MHDKKRCNQLQTLERLPTGCKVGADKGYQGLATDPVSTISTLDSETGETLHRLDKKLDDSCYTISLFSFYLGAGHADYLRACKSTDTSSTKGGR